MVMNPSVRLPFDSKRTAAALLAVTALTALFAWRQNQGGLVGGPISLAKTFWLNYALLTFFVLPFCLWRSPWLTEAARRLFGWVFALFVARGIVELWILYFTRDWKCLYGIAHDALTLGVILWMSVRLSRPRDARALQFAGLISISLCVEAFMAWQFSLLASPAQGIYFAANTPHFQFVNTASWVAVGLGYPALAFLTWRET